MKTIFEKLLAKTDDFVVRYKSDFEYDKKTIDENAGVPFIHIARESGTHLVMFATDLSELPKKGEKVPYMFGTASREQIIKNMVSAIEYFSNQKDNYLVHYFDGKKLSKIGFSAAIAIKNEYLDKVFSTWENEQTN
jgi:hypothetical protein